jgi:hypothetical protein
MSDWEAYRIEVSKLKWELETLSVVMNEDGSCDITISGRARKHFEAVR